MTAQQMLAFAILGGAVACFAWGRFRYDVVALVALLISVLTGVVKPKAAFGGFTSDVVVIIASALVVSAAVARSGVVEQLLQKLLARLRDARTQVPALAAATGALSMVTKNVGALAIMMPVAIRLSRHTRTSASSLLMPMSFMALLGGLVTLVGTSTNIIVSQIRADTIGKPFQLFDFAPVGLTLTAIGFVWVSVGWRLLPRNRQAQEDIHAALDAPYAAEAAVPSEWPDALSKLRDLDLGRDNVKAMALIHSGRRVTQPRATARLHAGDTLVLEGEQDALNAVFTRTPLVHAPVADNGAEEGKPGRGRRAVEAVVQPSSVLVGRPAGRSQLLRQFGVSLLAISRSGKRLASRLRNVTLRAGDVLILEADEGELPMALRGLALLPLVEREVQVGGLAAGRFLPISILVVAMLLVAFRVLPVQIAFFAAAVAVIAVGSISVREAYASLDAQVLILIGALTPISEAVQASGGARVIADGLAILLRGMPALLILAALMVTAMACSPFLHNAPTVLILGPIGVALAARLALSPDAFLMAVAAGAGCDFLTPVGHQCNTLVMGPGGYRFGDYARLGLPLSILVILVGAPLIAVVWPLH